MDEAGGNGGAGVGGTPSTPRIDHRPFLAEIDLGCLASKG